MRMAAARRLLKVGALSLLPLLFTTCQHDSTAPQQVATHLAFTTAPIKATVASAIVPALQITAMDGAGAPVPTFTGNVTIAIAPGTGVTGATLSGATTVAASGGVATFTGLSIDKVGSGYELAAAATGLTGATSAAFPVDPGAAAQLFITTQPGNTTAGTTIPVSVTARDALGNTATGFSGNVTLTIGSNPGSSTLGGTTTVAAVAGVANFSISLNRPGSGYTVSASATGLPSATSAGFDIAVGTATQLGFAVQPSTGAAGSAIAPAVVVAAEDQAGNTVATFAGNVTVALAVNPGSGALSGTLTMPLTSGVATFSTVAIDKIGSGYKLIATTTGLTSATSAAFDVVSGPATQLVVTSQPVNTTAGATITPAVVVTAKDALGNTAAGFNGTVTMAIGTNPSGGTLAGTTSVTAAGGIASFSTLSIAQAGSGYTLVASASGLTGATTTAFDILVGAAAKLAFTVQPSPTSAGAAITPAVTVTAQDAAGNTITGFTGNVTVAIGTNPSAGALSGTLTVAPVNGVATFSTLSIDKAGNGYTLQASAIGLASATSDPFDIGGGPATQLAVTVQPGNATAGQSITPALEVTARDALGNRSISFTGNVTVAISAGTGTAGATLSGTKIVQAVAGVASFQGLSIDKTGTGYTLTATAAGVTSATSAAFNVAEGPATSMVFTVQPSNAAAGAAIAPAVQVTMLDAVGNTATNFTGNVTVAIGTNPSGGALSGTATIGAVAGVATFPGLSINKAGTGYTLTAATTGLTTVTSAAFNITPGPAAALAFTGQPSGSAAGAAITPPVVVTAQDALGNTATAFTGNLTVAITSGTGTAGATLGGTTTVAAVAGIATFSTLSIDKNGAGYTLTATGTGVTSATSGAFDVAVGAATKLVFTVPPVNTTAGTAITPDVAVSVQDAIGNTVTSFTGSVTMAIGTNPGSGTLAGVTTVAAVAGVATFPGLSINKTGTGYTLTASATGVTSSTSAAFNITPGTAATLEFTVQPTTTAATATITPGVQVTAKDALGNVATGFTANVTVAIGTNPSTGTLSGTTTVAAAAGVATFSALSIDKAGTGYTLTATATGPTGATSTAFNIVAGTATKLVFTVQPSATAAGAAITPPVQVTAQDAGGNTVTTFSGNVAVAITSGTGTAGATLSGSKSVAAVGGVATFSTLSIDKTGTGYTLTATGTGLTSATSGAFDVAVGSATKLVFSVQPVNTTAGTAITPAVAVTAQDAVGNTVTSFTGNVTVAIGTNAGGGTLSGVPTVAAVAGVATFPGLSINKTGTGYTLTASATGFTDALSAAFNITSGPAATLEFTAQPTTTAAATAITPAVQVTAKDALGNVATGFTGTVTVAIGTNPSSGTLSGTKAVAAVAGVATFSTLNIDKAGNGYTLTAAATGPTGATSVGFSIVVGTATKLAFAVQPSTTTAGAAIAPPVQVAAQDAGGNTVTTFSGSVTVAITSGTGTAGATLSGTATVGLVNGVATFSTLSINKSGTGYRLTATETGLTSVNSNTFNINTGPAALLGFTVQPVNTAAGSSITPAVKVTALDAAGNTVTTFTSNISVVIGANPGSGVLSGATSVAAVAGVATFSNLSINKTGTSYTLIASATGLTNVASATFNITPGATTKLAFLVQPVSTAALAPITPAVQVVAQDNLGNTATGFTGNVTMAIGTNPVAGTLSGTLTKAAVGGIAIFSDLSINVVGNGYTLRATSGTLTAAVSASFDITGGNNLKFTVQPTSTTAGATIAPAVQVTARDGNGNTLTLFTGNITIAILAGTGTPGATLAGTTTVAAVAGVATFSNLSIAKSGSGYKLTATASGFTAGTSSQFTINPGTPVKLGFITQPSTTPAGSLIIPGPEVAVQDAQGNTVKGISGTITVAIGTNPASGTLSGTLTGAISAGVASFPNLSINNAGSGYTLVASSTGFTNGTSASFTITAAATIHLAFTVQPVTTTAGLAITPAVQVTARDGANQTVTSFTGSVTIDITSGAGPNGATLSGTKTVTAVNGVATFSDLSITKAGSGYKLSAEASGVAGATSTSFVINPAAAAKLSFGTQPTSTTVNTTISPAPTVDVLDAFNNLVTSFVGNVTVALGTNPTGATLNGTKTVAVVAGTATFSTLSINLAGTGYDLAATSSGLTAASSSGFNIN